MTSTGGGPDARDPVRADPDLRRLLRNLHAVEQQALVHLRLAAKLVRDPDLSSLLSAHHAETECHRDALRAELGSSGSWPRDLAATANRLGFLGLTAMGDDAAGKMLVDSITYEYFEVAAYRLLGELAGERGEPGVAELAGRIAREEKAMADRLTEWLDWAARQAHRRSRCSASLRRHLQDVHALETQSAVLLRAGSHLVRRPDLRRYCAEELKLTAGQRGRLRERLAELDSSPSGVRSGAMTLAGAAWGGVWGVQRYTAAKLTCFIYAERHLQVASYELLVREAIVCGDGATGHLARDLLGQERGSADRMELLLSRAADRSA
ncbi:MAG TPA: DUF892 family protein [Solirubrobacteraceae bacterium]|nr:DUF892 family protein [Solirubrobacteraceae bacterium]